MTTCSQPALATLALVALAGCGESGDLPTAAERPAPALMSPSDRAREAVAARLGIAAADVSIVSITARDFPDSSLDCPEPDMLYQQVITPGHQVILEAESRRFDVRVAGEGARICHRRKRSGSRGDQRLSPVQLLAEDARADLARRLQIAPDAVRVNGIRALRPGDELPGCAWDCPPEAGVCGYAISLLHDERRFDYFASRSQIRPCPPIAPS